ncbi:MAG: hypothetical protein ACPGVU_09020 [Limisphaerales bacterium]
MIQTYDIGATYCENYDCGPNFDGVSRIRVPDTPMKEFLGLPVRSRIGIAAGLLLNSKWIVGYAERGFDILTYKTVRSGYRPCYDPPNWVFVDDEGRDAGPVYAVDTPEADPTKVSSAVCFGMPSMAPEDWRSDVATAKSSLLEGQILVVSVVATPEAGASREAVAEDFAQCAEWALEAGADVIEANFSCPNVCTPEGTIYQDAKLSRFIAGQIRSRIGAARLLLKVGYFPGKKTLESFMIELNNVVDGITLVNGVSRPVLHRDGRPVFGEDYVQAGVLGRSIHQPSIANVRQAAAIRDQHELELAILAVGGVSRVEDMQDFYQSGADAVMLGSSPMYLPQLAAEAKRLHPDW